MEVRADDYGYTITFTVVQSDGTTAENLTGVTYVKFQVVNAQNYRNEFTGDCVITDAVNGVCTYPVAAGNFNEAGNYLGCLEIKYSITRIETTEDISITVKRSFG